MSNLAFAVPAAVAVAHEIVIGGALAALVGAVSAAYHASGEQSFARLDALLAWALVTHNAALFALAPSGQPYTLAACAALAAALYFFLAQGRDDWEWHLASAAVTLFCVLGYSAGL